jgi:hypothetical protein
MFHDYIKAIWAIMPILELQTNHPTINSMMSSSVIQAIAAPTAKDRTGMGKVIRLADALHELSRCANVDIFILLVSPKKLTRVDSEKRR